MEFYLDGEQVTLEELEADRASWEYHGVYSSEHQIIALDHIDGNHIYFTKLEYIED